MPNEPAADAAARPLAVVTGAARGIGAAIASVLASDGWDLALCDRLAEPLAEVAERCRAAGATVAAGVLDVRDTSAVATWVAGIAAGGAPVQALVNNAGGGFAAPFLDVSEKGQDALVRENFTSVATLVRAVVPHLPPPGPGRTGGGAIVNITSIEAHRAGPGFAVYSAMKAAVANLTMSLALELAPRHITVNCVAPDMIPTPGVGDLPVSTPLPYPGRPEDVAAAVCFLLGDGARFVTGTTLHVDGGNRAAGGWRPTGNGSYAT